MTGRPGPAAWAEKHLANPPLRALLRLGLHPRAFALIETTGRRTGRRRLTPVGNGLDGDVFWLIAARGHQSSYVANRPPTRAAGSRQADAGIPAPPRSWKTTTRSAAGPGSIRPTESSDAWMGWPSGLPPPARSRSASTWTHPSASTANRFKPIAPIHHC